MAKKKRNRKGQTDSNRDLMKPDYAMDKMDSPAKPKEEKPKEETFHVEDTLKGSTAERLAKLKEHLTVEEEQTKPLAITKNNRKKRPQPSAKDRLAKNPDLSFAELFDPADDDESSFEELLDDSKLDWRFFKDES